jgi:predicted amidohydrolase YtcJ/mono/diheme cytochrome c family protein
MSTSRPFTRNAWWLPLIAGVFACGAPTPGTTFTAAAGSAPAPAANLPAVTSTVAQVANGRRLVVAYGCGDCHGGWPNPAAAEWLAGRSSDGQQYVMGAWHVWPANLSNDPQTGIGRFTDRQLFNALRFGLRPGRTPDLEITSATPGIGNHPARPEYLAPAMPWTAYRHLSDRELRDIIAYLRQVEPVVHAIPEGVRPADVWLAEFTAPEIGSRPAPAFPTANEELRDPSRAAEVMHGRALVISLACGECHGGRGNPAAVTWMRGVLPADQRVHPGPYEQVFDIGPFKVYPRNLTPDNMTGMGRFSERQIFNAMRWGLRPGETADVEITSAVPGTGNHPQNPKYLAPPMPWPAWRHLSDAELWAVAAYLKHGLKPVRNLVADSEGPPDFWAGEYLSGQFGPWPAAPFPTARERAVEAESGIPSYPDMVLLNGKVFTADPARPWAEAIAIRGERIMAVGSSAEIRALAGAGTRRIELGGRVVIPGINDAHTHHAAMPAASGVRMSSSDPSWNEALDSLAAAVRRIPEDGWITGPIGPVILSDPRADRTMLDSIAPSHPVVLTGWTGHGAVLNTAAMRAGGISETEPDPAGGRWDRFAGSDRITGRHWEYAQFGMSRHRWGDAPLADGSVLGGTKRFAETALGYGITSIQNMSLLPPEEFLMLLRQADQPIRVRVIRFPISGRSTNDSSEGWGVARRPDGLPRVTVSGTKWILDGTPIEQGAAMHAPYAPNTGTGTLNFNDAEIRVMLRESVEHDDPLLVHAGGDRAVEAVLSAMESIGGVDWPARRVRLEHGDGLKADQFTRARRLGIVVVQNPAHFTDPDIYAKHYGPDHGFQPLRSLIEAGIPIALGSDGPLNPYLNIMWAVTHAVRPDEAISREQAVVAYTRGSAYAEFTEHEKGTLAPGMLADLAVLSQDIFVVPVAELPRTVSILTLVGGRVAHDTLGTGAAAAASHPSPGTH